MSTITMIPENERAAKIIPITVGGRVVRVTTVGYCDHAPGLVPILARGDVAGYIDRLMQRCQPRAQETPA